MQSFGERSNEISLGDVSFSQLEGTFGALFER